jgi:hypothetical protein
MRSREVMIAFIALLLLFIVGATLAHYSYPSPVEDLSRPSQQDSGDQ